jgi:hypothetical protein
MPWNLIPDTYLKSEARYPVMLAQFVFVRFSFLVAQPLIPWFFCSQQRFKPSLNPIYYPKICECAPSIEETNHFGGSTAIICFMAA